MTANATPYRSQPARAFWSRAVARDWDPDALPSAAQPLLVPEDRIVSAGSCFAANVVPRLEAAGYAYVRTETIDEAEDRFHYGRYSAAYGNIYTARQFRQLVERCLGRFRPREDRWLAPGAVIDPFRPGLPFPAEDEAEFDLATGAHLDRTREAFGTATVLLFTLGLTESWVSSLDGAVFPACPGVVAGAFDPARHRFVNFRVSEIVADMNAALALLGEINPALRTILTVSPVPLVATATGHHVYAANAYSKAALRAAAEEIAADNPAVVYFPALEIVLGLEAGRNFEADRRSVSAEAVERVVGILLRHSRASAPSGTARTAGAAEKLSGLLAQKECEEAMNEGDSAN